MGGTRCCSARQIRSSLLSGHWRPHLPGCHRSPGASVWPFGPGSLTTRVWRELLAEMDSVLGDLFFKRHCCCSPRAPAASSSQSSLLLLTSAAEASSLQAVLMTLLILNPRVYFPYLWVPSVLGTTQSFTCLGVLVCIHLTTSQV